MHRISRGKRDNLDTEDLVDAESDVGVTSLKSKSPVSLEIHLPSTLGESLCSRCVVQIRSGPIWQ